MPNIEGATGCPPNGAPNCCDDDAPSCLDAQASAGAVNLLASEGVPTYVVGVPGSGPYATVLDDMAKIGGTDHFYDVTTADEAPLEAALSSIAARITATCTFTLATTPPDPGLVNVYLDDTLLPAADGDGWTLDGTTVTLTGAACTKVESGAVLGVRVVVGCPTVVN